MVLQYELQLSTSLLRFPSFQFLLAAVVQVLGSMCGPVGNVGFLECIPHKVVTSGVQSDTLLRLMCLERAALYLTLDLPSSPENSGKPFQVKGLILALSLSI